MIGAAIWIAGCCAGVGAVWFWLSERSDVQLRTPLARKLYELERSSRGWE